jgi:hypothetical protein
MVQMVDPRMSNVSASSPTVGSGQSVSDSSSFLRDVLPKYRSKLPVAVIKQHMERAIQDLKSIHVDRLTYRIRNAHNAGELWMLRSDVYQVIATQINQSEATRRVNSLLPCFDKWIADKQRSEI